MILIISILKSLINLWVILSFLICRDNSWWSRRTRLERNLCASTAFLFSTSILTFGILVLLEFKYKIIESYIDHEDNIFIKDLNNSNAWTTYSNERQSQGLSDICLTPACIEAGMLSIFDGIDLNALYMFILILFYFFLP